MSWRTNGSSSPRCIKSSTRKISLRPKIPPGWRTAKSSSLKPFCSSNTTARASPIASATVVLAVGANPSGQASFTRTLSTTSPARASDDSGLPVMTINLIPCSLKCGSSLRISSVSPLLETARITSPFITMPRSPCMPSPEWRKNAGVPVLAKVAAILRQIKPDFPSPVTTTLPRHWRNICTARTKLSSRRSTMERIPSASMRSTSAARVSAALDFTPARRAPASPARPPA